ncbi:hypothetical protein EB796_021931 [Bugula neritina]|uniref:Uncharacterized protein n=1 Tax=Bugula neritina TaxID=10212 RepID=A0A7J7J0R2_BUGNE|nr:hypothetical protein EB796_021931 [Bugula neritina]
MCKLATELYKNKMMNVTKQSTSGIVQNLAGYWPYIQGKSRTLFSGMQGINMLYTNYSRTSQRYYNAFLF